MPKNSYEYQKEYMKKYNKERFECDVCNCSIVKGAKQLHLKSKKHIKNQEHLNKNKSQIEKLLKDVDLIELLKSALEAKM